VLPWPSRQLALKRARQVGRLPGLVEKISHQWPVRHTAGKEACVIDLS